MTGKRLHLLLGILLFVGCSTSSSPQKSRPYLDPLTYSFEAYTPYQEEDPLLQMLTKMKESARQIREWEKKYLW